MSLTHFSVNDDFGPRSVQVNFGFMLVEAFILQSIHFRDSPPCQPLTCTCDLLQGLKFARQCCELREHLFLSEAVGEGSESVLGASSSIFCSTHSASSSSCGSCWFLCFWLLAKSEDLTFLAFLRLFLEAIIREVKCSCKADSERTNDSAGSLLARPKEEDIVETAAEQEISQCRS